MKKRISFGLAALVVVALTVTPSAQQFANSQFNAWVQIVRGAFSANYPEGMPAPFVANNRGDHLIAQSLPPSTELTRLGGSFQVQTSAAAAALTATPTTTAALSLWNGEPATGRSYVIDSVAAFEIVVDATQSNQTALFVMNNRIPVTAPTDAALTIRSFIGRAYSGRARTLVAGSVTNEGWFPACSSASGAAAAGGSAWKVTDCPLGGAYIVPPGGMFSVQVAKAAATAGQIQSVIRWHEVQLVLGF